MRKDNYLKKELYELIKTDESIFDFIQEGSLDGLWYRDLEHPENMWTNNRFWEVLGYNPENMPNKTAAWQDIINEDDLAITNEKFRKHSDNPKHPHNQLVRYTHKNGSTVWIRCRVMVIRDKSGKPVRMLGANHDITETKNKELGVEKDSLLNKSYQLANIGHWELDLVNDILFWSTEVKNLHEVDQDYQPDVETAIDFYPEGKNRTTIQQAVHEAIENGKAYDLELKITTAKGNEKWIRTTGDAIQENGTCIKLYGSTQDISKRKLAEERLQKSEERFRVAQEYSPDGFTILQPLLNEQNEITDFIWVYQNQTIASINGTQEQNVIGKRLLEVFPTHEGTEIFETYVEVYNTGKPKILDDVYAGEVLKEPTWLRLVVIPMGGEIAILAQNETDRKQAEQALQLQSKITENLAEGVYLSRSSDGVIVYTNPTFDRMFGYNSGELIGKHVSILNAPTEENPEETAKKIIQNLTERGTWSGEVYNIKKNGTTFWCSANVSTFMHLEYGEVWVSVHNDITDRKKTEEKLKLFNRAIEASSVSVVITDSEGRIDYVNPYFTEVTGYSFEEVHGGNPRILKSGKQSKAFYEDLWYTIKSGKDWSGQFQNKKKNGELYWEKAIISPILSDDTGEITHFVAIKEDITDLLSKENELKRSLKEKQALLSEVHHRVKNNLAVVSALMQLESFEEENPEVLEILSGSISRIKTIANIHENLYKQDNFSNVDLSESIRSLAHEIVNTFNKGKTIDVNLSLEQVQLNINQAVPFSVIVNEVILNALKHAFAGRKGGSIHAELSEKDGMVMIRISDDGVGIPENFKDSGRTSGTTIIDILSQQLAGTYNYKRLEQGTEFILSFEKSEVKGIYSNVVV